MEAAADATQRYIVGASRWGRYMAPAGAQIRHPAETAQDIEAIPPFRVFRVPGQRPPPVRGIVGYGRGRRAGHGPGAGRDSPILEVSLL